MKKNFADDKIAFRLGGMNFGKSPEIYKFEKIKQARRKALALHPEREIIDLGVGEPDKPADPGIVRVLQEEAGKNENRFYSDNGIPEFQQAAARFLKRVYGVNIDHPETKIIHGIGSKPILAMLPLCFINPGDYVLATVPGYPVISTYTEYLGGRVYPLPLLPGNGFYPDLDAIPGDVLKKAKLLYLNYPNNPTGRTATREFFSAILEFALTHNMLVVNDAAYSALVFDGRPLSILSVEGAGDVCIEVHSLSKSFNMTGWRLAFVTGNEKVIKAYGTVKDNTDSGQFRAIQKAGMYALDHPELILRNTERYSRRFDLLVASLRRAGFRAEKPGGTFYCYVKCPAGTKKGDRFENAEQCASFLLENASVSTVPWDDAGAYLRLAVTYEARDEIHEREIMQELERRLAGLNLLF